MVTDITNRLFFWGCFFSLSECQVAVFSDSKTNYYLSFVQKMVQVKIYMQPCTPLYACLESYIDLTKAPYKEGSETICRVNKIIISFTTYLHCNTDKFGDNAQQLRETTG